MKNVSDLFQNKFNFIKLLAVVELSDLLVVTEIEIAHK